MGSEMQEAYPPVAAAAISRLTALEGLIVSDTSGADTLFSENTSQ